VELRHLRYFAMTAELLNLTQAAARLRVAQPALSRQIHDLEEELGVQLFERSSRGLRMTEAGAAFLSEAQAILQRSVDAVELVRAVARGERGEIHIGYAPSPTVELLPCVLHEFHQVAPGFRVTLHDLSTKAEMDGLRENRLQAALTVDSDAWTRDELKFEPLRSYPMCLAVSPRSPLAKKRRISITEVAMLPWLAFGREEYPEYHAALEACMKAAGTKLRIAQEHESVTSLLAALEIGSGVAILPSCVELLAASRVKLIPLTPAPPPLVVGIAYHPQRVSAVGQLFLAASRGAAAPEFRTKEKRA
jgi:DNA-binding transcriptional LysR family regulator